ncbi:hypothetical protein AB0L75_41420 [Streptomyces sp. NPDC052101]|uniref:hypothetical protein n=1 Tax=Streptomyces sp. NPDC052101 TaxID=3155763 RepID=UPI003441AC2A
MPADSWIGNSCVMDRDHVAAVYAPRRFTNKPDLMQGGAFTAIVDLKTGKVTKLAFTASLAYFDPTCNPGTGTAVFSAFRDDKTHLVTVDTSGKTSADTTARGQITSAVPVEDGVIAARGPRLVHIDRSSEMKDLTATDGVPFQIRAAGKGRVVFLDHNGSTARAKLWTGKGKPPTLASGKLGDLALKQGDTGRVFLTGRPQNARLSGTPVTQLNAGADTDVSSLGHLAVDPVLMPGIRHGLARIKDAGKGFTKPEPQPTPRMPQDPTDESSGDTAPAENVVHARQGLVRWCGRMSARVVSSRLPDRHQRVRGPAAATDERPRQGRRDPRPAPPDHRP